MLKAEIIGNLGADAQIIANSDGKFLSFRVADSKKYVDRSTGEVVKSVTWVSVTLNGDGGNLVKYLVKGTKVYVRGFLSSRLYTGNDGKKHAGLNIAATEIELCGGSRENDIKENYENNDKNQDDEPF